MDFQIYYLKEDLNVIKDWKQSNKYQFNNQYEKDLYNALVERRYIMSNIEAEKEYKES